MKLSKHRGGYSLIEMLLSVTVATVLLGINVGWIHQTMKFASVTKQRQRQQQSLTRLAWELRDDVRVGDSISMVGDDQLVIKSGGNQVTYTISGTQLMVEKSDDQPIKRQERFELARNATAVWDTSEMPEWISLIVYRGGESVENPSDVKSEAPIPEANQMPADLHIRVGPNRWNTKPSDDAPAKTGEEDSK